MPNNNGEIEKRLWDAADSLRANSGLKASEYSVPVLGLIFLRFADYKFSLAEEKITKNESNRRPISKIDYQAQGVLFLPSESRFSYLLNLSEGSNIGEAVNKAMEAVEAENEDLKGILPRNYGLLDNQTLVELLKTFNSIAMDLEGDVFGKIYEYFLGKFAMSEGQKGGEFFTPTSIVKLIVQVIEPYKGRILDPACGSGGMFVQSAHFIENHQKNPNSEIAIYGQEKTNETVRLCKMNLAVHGLSGDIREGNTYYNDIHQSVGKFDFVMANPPFNVDGIDKDRIKDDPRFPLGIPRVDNGNYLWIQVFYSSLNEKGRAGFVMASNAIDAGDSEKNLRRKLIDTKCVDVIISIASNFFYTVTLPCTLWFLDKNKSKKDRQDKILFINAKKIYKQLDKSHREFAPEQVEFISNIVRLYRNEAVETTNGSAKLMQEYFPKGHFTDVEGLCKVVKIDELDDWSLNPSKYVGLDDSSETEPPITVDSLIEDIQNLSKKTQNIDQQINTNLLKLFNISKKNPLIHSELGLIPKGWTIKKLSEVADVIDCLHSKKPERTKEGKTLLQVWNIGEDGLLDLEDRYLISESDYKLWTSRTEVVPGDCIITNVGRIGAVAQVPEEVNAAIGRNMTAIKCRRGWMTPTYLIEYFLSPIMRKEIYKKMDSGTVMDSLNVKGIMKLRIVVPPYEVLERFEEIVMPIRQRVELSVSQKKQLNNARRLLIPKLMKGEVRV